MAASRGVLVVLFFGVLLSALDIAVLGPALPAMRDTFGVDARTGSWLFNAFVFANFVGVPLMATLSDRLGRRPVFMLDVALFGLGALLVGSMSTFEGVLLGRVLQGLAASGVFPAAAAVVGDQYPPEERGKALGMLGAVFGLAFLFGPAISGAVLAVGKWQWLFWGMTAGSLVCLSIAYRVLPVTRGADPTPFDAFGLVVLAVGSLAFAIALNTASVAIVSGWFWLWVVVLLVGFLLIATYVRHMRRVDHAVVSLQFFADPFVRRAMMIGVITGVAEATFIFMSEWLITAYGLSRSAASYWLIPLTAAVAVASPIAGRLIKRVGVARVLAVGLSAMAFGLAILAIAQTTLSFYVFGAIGLGGGLAIVLGPSLSYVVLGRTPASRRSRGQGVITLSISLGQMLGGASLGALITGVGGILGFRLAFAVSSVLCVLGWWLSRHIAAMERSS